MVQFLVSYDVESSRYNPHQKILDQAQNFEWYRIAKDYRDKFENLPNTTLTGWFDDLLIAQKQFYGLIARARSDCSGTLVVEKHIITEMGSFVFSADRLG